MQQQEITTLAVIRLQRYASFIMVSVIVLSGLVLIGWQFDIRIFTQPIPGLAAMNPMTAVTFLLCCLGLSIIRSQPKNNIKPRANGIKLIVSAILMIATAWILYDFNIYDTGIAQLLYPDQTAKSVTNNRANIMAPGTAVNFICTGITLLLLNANKYKLAQYLSLFSGFIALLAVIGYIYEVESFYGPFYLFAMAVHTAISFLLLSISILFFTSARGLMSELMNTYSKSKTVLLLFPLMIIVPILLGKFRLLGEQNKLYDTAFGTALFATVNIIIFTLIIWKFMIQINRSHARLEKEVIERKKASEAIKKAHRQIQKHLTCMQLLMNTSLDIICIIDEEGRFVHINETCEKIWGYTPEELIGNKYIELVHPDDRAASAKVAAEIVTGGSLTNFENRYYKKDGTIVPLIWTAIWSEDEKLIYCIAKDYTEEKKTQKKIKDYRYRISHIVESINDGFLSTDTSWNITYCNKEAAAFFYDQKEQLIGKCLFNLHKNKEQQNQFSQLYNKCREVASANQSANLEFFIEKESKWLDISIYPAEDGLSIYFKDITDRKKEEEYLRLLESVVTNATDAIIITEAGMISHPGPKIIYVNDAFCKMTGYSKDEIMGRTPRILQGQKTDSNKLNVLRSALEKKQTCEIEIINYRKTGEEYWVQMAIAPVIDNKGIVTHFLSIERDVTIQKNNLIHIENQNTALREIAWQQSHLVRAPLARILGLLNLLNNHIIVEEEKKVLLTHIKTSADELDNTIREIVRKTETLQLLN